MFARQEALLMPSLTPLLATVPLTLASQCSAATTQNVTAANFDGAWRSAACGSTLILRAEEYGPRVLGSKACGDKPLTIEAKGATLVNWTGKGVSGLTIRGGTIKNQDNGTRWSPALTFQGSRNP